MSCLVLLALFFQTPEDEKKVVITATRRAADPFDIPYAVDTIDRKELLNTRLVRTLPDALAETPGVMVQKTSPGQGSPFIRGFTGFRTVMMIDGIRLNNSTFREGPNQYWNTVDPFSIEQLEIVKGCASVLYGSDAIGGAVNALTLRPHTYREGLGWATRTYGRYASADQSMLARGEVAASLDQRVGVVIGGSWRDFDDIEGGQHVGTQPHTGYFERNGDAKIELSLSDHVRLALAHQIVNQDDAWRTHITTSGISWHGTAVGTDQYRILDQNRELTYLQLHAEQLGGWLDAAHVSASWHVQDEFEDRKRSNGQVNKQGVDVGTLGLWAQLESKTRLGHLTYGAELYHDEVSSFTHNFNSAGVLTSVGIQGPVGDDAEYDLIGVYLQDEMALGERWKLIAGVRYTRAEADANEVEDPVTKLETSIEDDWSNVSGSLKGIYTLTSEINLFGGVAQGFRAPNFSDLTRLDIARSGELEIASLDLDPEEYLSFELGAKAAFSRWEGELALFYTIIDNMIIRRPTGNIVSGLTEVTKENEGDGYVTGVELSGRWKATDVVTAFGSLVWMRGDVDQFPTSAPDKEREPLSRVQPATAIVGVRVEPKEWNLWVESVVTMVDGAYRQNTADDRDNQRIPPGGTPGYTLYGVRGGYKICPNATVSLAIENITNKDYRVHGSGSNEPGTNVIIGLDITY